MYPISSFHEQIKKCNSFLGEFLDYFQSLILYKCLFCLDIFEDFSLHFFIF